MYTLVQMEGVSPSPTGVSTYVPTLCASSQEIRPRAVEFARNLLVQENYVDIGCHIVGDLCHVTIAETIHEVIVVPNSV